MIHTVLSDLGKVIINFDNRIFYKRIAGFCSYTEGEISEMVRTHFDLIKSFDKGEISPKTFYTQVTKILNAEIDYEDFFPIYNSVFSLNPFVLEILNRLKPKYRLFLLSNTDVMRFGFIKKRFPEILIFDDYILSFELGLMKPQPEIYMKALERAQARAEEVVFIDDMEENIEAAYSLGIHTILFESQTDLEFELRKKGLFF